MTHAGNGQSWILRRSAAVYQAQAEPDDPGLQRVQADGVLPVRADEC